MRRCLILLHAVARAAKTCDESRLVRRPDDADRLRRAAIQCNATRIEPAAAVANLAVAEEARRRGRPKSPSARRSSKPRTQDANHADEDTLSPKKAKMAIEAKMDNDGIVLSLSRTSHE